MSELLKILTQIDNGDQKALLCELPRDVVSGLNIGSDGSVDLEALIKLCKRITEEKSPSAKEARDYKRHQKMMSLIFDSSRAVDFNPRDHNRTD